MIRLSISLRQTLSRLTLPVLFATTFAVMLLGKADAVLVAQARITLGDTLAPFYGLVALPVQRAHRIGEEIAGLWHLRAENAALRAENIRLRRWQAVAMALDAENTQLKKQLHWLPDPPVSFVTARVVDDAGGLYARDVLLATAPGQPITKGEVVVDSRGLVGRVTEVGKRSVRVMLITDLNSRLPVTLEKDGARAILAGTNGARPRLMYWPAGQTPVEGERVVTSAVAGAFPAGLPVGVVHFSAAHVPQVTPYAALDRLQLVRVLDYRLHAPIVGVPVATMPPLGTAAGTAPTAGAAAGPDAATMPTAAQAAAGQTAAPAASSAATIVPAAALLPVPPPAPPPPPATPG